MFIYTYITRILVPIVVYDPVRTYRTDEQQKKNMYTARIGDRSNIDKIFSYSFT